jgi:hypothetical protein
MLEKWGENGMAMIVDEGGNRSSLLYFFPVTHYHLQEKFPSNMELSSPYLQPLRKDI